MGPGSDDAGSSSVPEDLRSFPGVGASVLVSSGGSLVGDTVRVTVRSEDAGVLGPLAPKKSSGLKYEILQCFARQECFYLPAAHTDEPWSVALHGPRCTKPPLEDLRFSPKHLLDQKEQRARNEFMHGHRKRIRQ